MAVYRPIPFVHLLLKQHLSHSSYVIDATIGNGFDAEYITGLLDKNGKFFGFDVQAPAIAATNAKISDAKCPCELYLTGHEQMYHYLERYENQIDAIVFNLGFLPHTNEQLTTTWNTTYRAILQSVSLLRHKGVLIIVSYPGHAEGEFEDNALNKLLSAQSPTNFYISTYHQLGTDVNTPIVYAIEKRLK